MWNVSDEWADALSATQSWVTKVNLYRGSEVVAEDVAITNGSVDAQGCGQRRLKPPMQAIGGDCVQCHSRRAGKWILLLQGFIMHGDLLYQTPFLVRSSGEFPRLNQKNGRFHCLAGGSLSIACIATMAACASCLHGGIDRLDLAGGALP